MSDLSRVPLIALSDATKQLISTRVNPPTVFPSSDGLPRDWRGLAQVCFIGGETYLGIAAESDHLSHILNIIQKQSQDFTLQNLKDALEKIERWDIVEDSQKYFEKDANLYLQRLQESQITAKENNFSIESDILTLDDQFRIERGQEKQHYDAFLLYADEDITFVNEVVENLEKKNNLKLCLKERDLIAGISFEHEAIMRLISERCNRIVTIISPDFLKSPANKFFLNFAQATGIDKGQDRKIIPCIYKHCELPPQLTYFSKIYYKKFSTEFFWDKLIRSMKTTIEIPKTVNSLDETKSCQLEKSNNFIQKKSNEEHEVKESLIQEISKLKDTNSSIQNVVLNNVLNSNPECTSSESLPKLPSLDKLDSLSTLTSCTSTSKTNNKKKNFMNKYVKKVQALLPKS